VGDLIPRMGAFMKQLTAVMEHTHRLLNSLASTSEEGMSTLKSTGSDMHQVASKLKILLQKSAFQETNKAIERTLAEGKGMVNDLKRLSKDINKLNDLMTNLIEGSSNLQITRPAFGLMTERLEQNRASLERMNLPSTIGIIMYAFGILIILVGLILIGLGLNQLREA